MTDEASFTATVKGGKDFDRPWLVVRADTEQELESKLQAVESGGSLATLGRITEAFAAQFNLGAQLGARSVSAPVNSQPSAEQNAVDPNWGAPQQSPAPSYNQQPAAPSYGGGYGGPAAVAQPPAGGRPGVPMILGREAKWIDKGKWKAWADPRSQSETEYINEKTDNPNHPGLAAGTHKFWAFVR